MYELLAIKSLAGKGSKVWDEIDGNKSISTERYNSFVQKYLSLAILSRLSLKKTVSLI